MVPSDAGLTDCEPAYDLLPDQSLSAGSAEAVQDVAFVVDHVSVAL